MDADAFFFFERKNGNRMSWLFIVMMEFIKELFYMMI